MWRAARPIPLGENLEPARLAEISAQNALIRFIECPVCRGDASPGPGTARTDVLWLAGILPRIGQLRTVTTGRRHQF